MPEVVARGGPKTGGAGLRALPSDRPATAIRNREPRRPAGRYMIRQMAAFKNGERKGNVRADVMIAIAKALSDAEDTRRRRLLRRLAFPGYNKVIETPTR